ncbi:hypothetical protein LCGC14_0397580 [marine sediment metagenome]|uniref:Uncharacterized protein n=1 Tax=marine sediment metagenome TaxID=412755 RepID=A0A0F9T3T0_9ZZZZ
MRQSLIDHLTENALSGSLDDRRDEADIVMDALVEWLRENQDTLMINGVFSGEPSRVTWLADLLESE